MSSGGPPIRTPPSPPPPGAPAAAGDTALDVLRAPPRCPGSLLLGNTRALLDDTAGAIVSGYRLLGPVFRMRAAWRRLTIIAGPEADEVFARGLDETHLTRRGIFTPIEREFGACPLVLSAGGDMHARLRTLLAIGFSRQAVSPLVPAVTDAVRAEVRRWPLGESLPALPRAQALALAGFGALLGAPELVFADWKLATDYMMNVTAGQLPPLVFLAPWYRGAHRRNHASIRAALARRRAEPGGTPTLFDSLAAARAPGAPPLSDEEIVSYAAYGAGASIGYVGRLAAFLLYEVLRDEELLAAATAEVRAAFADGLTDARGIRRMVVLGSAYHETLRVHPFAIGMPFEVVTPFEFHGYTVRPGGRLIVSPVPSSFSDEHFPEAHRFDAARCREPRNEHHSNASRPFGLGHRTCSAMGLVGILTTTLVATLLHERQVASHPRGYRLRRSVWPLPAPDRGFRLRVDAATTAGPTSPATPAAPAEDDVLALFPGHDDPAVRRALEAATRRACHPGEVLLREGDAADAFYLVEAGEVRVTSGGAHLADLGVGAWFGEVGLLTGAPRNATVVAGDGGAAVRVLPREAFLGLVAASDLVASEIGALLRKRLATGRLREATSIRTADGVARLLPEFRPSTAPRGATIVQEGDPADAFYVIVGGEVEVFQRGRAEPVGRLGPGEYFGERGLLHGAPRNATVVAASDVDLLVTDVAGFERVLNESGGRDGDLAKAMLARVR